MKFENVSLLMESLGKKLDSFGDTVEVWIMSPFSPLSLILKLTIPECPSPPETYRIRILCSTRLDP